MKYRWFDFGEKKIPYYKKEIGENSDLLHCALYKKRVNAGLYCWNSTLS